MANETNKTELRWYHIRRTRLTREYAGGILAGFGLGCIVTMYLFHKNILPFELWILGFILIAIGSTMALSAQRQQETDSD